MFAWEVAGLCLSALGVFRRCHYATVAQEEQEKQFRERVQAELEVCRDEERKKVREREEQMGQGAPSPDMIEKAPTHRTEADLEVGSSAEGDTESELSRVMSRADDRMRRQESKASRVGYGPAFGLPFLSNEDSNEEQR